MILAGTVLGTFSAREGESGYPRPAREVLRFREGYGIEEDKFAGGKPHKQVLIVGTKPYEMAREIGVELEPGSLGENLLLDFDPHEFTAGTIFGIGDAKIEVVESCTLCNHLSVFDKRLPRLIRDHRGLYCRILSDGEVRSGMKVAWFGRA